MDSGTFTPDALIFDVDGVLINAEKSFPEVIRISILEGWEKFCGGDADSPGYTKEHARILKQHGAFNDDYDIVWALLSMAEASGSAKLSQAFPTPERLAEEVKTYGGSMRSWVETRYGAGVPYREVHEMCLNRYMGELYLMETPMLRCHWKELPLPAAVYTGRNGAEWLLAKKILGWEDFPDELVINSDSGVKKPSAEGLELLCARLGASRPAFFGDTASDIMSSRAFGRGYFVAVGDLLPDAEHIYKETEEALAALLNFKTGGAGI